LKTHELAALRGGLAVRSRVLQAVRSFFWDRGFLEVETPVRVPRPALESHIDAVPSGRCYLRTSPELHMKRLLAAGFGPMFQVGPCFREGENGRLHAVEFTMLEWYRPDAGYLDILDDTRALLLHVVRTVAGASVFDYDGVRVDVAADWPCITVRDAYRRFAGWDPVAAFDADRFDLDMVGKVEPALPRDRPVVLMDYPAAAAALARRKPGAPSVAERWELYVAGLELANAFGELTDPVEQRLRFEECARARRLGGATVYEPDEAFLAALEDGMPPSGGIALGIDRLVMLLAGARAIDEIRPFCRDGHRG
jgi:lysyl-tRNA synthetase class 2